MFFIYSVKILQINYTTKYFVLIFINRIDLFYYIVVQDDCLDTGFNLNEINSGSIRMNRLVVVLINRNDGR